MTKLLIPLISGIALSTLTAVDFLKFSDGKALTVVNSSAVKSIVNSNEGQSLDLYDRTTGILIGESETAAQYKIGKIEASNIGQGFLNSDNKLVANLLGVERRKDENVLSFAYYLVSKTEEKLESGDLLFDKNGKAVAFYYVDNNQKQNQGYIVPVQAVQRAHDDFVKNKTVSRAWAGIIVSPTGTIPEIISIRPDSPAAQAGIKVGDIITGVGEHKVFSYLESVNAFYYLIPNVEVQFEIVRDGKVLTLPVTPISRASLGE